MKIGDHVSVTDENLSGIICGVRGRTVTFTDEYGFSHHYQKEKLVLRDLDFYENIRTEKKPEPRKTVSKKHSKNIFTLDLHFEKLVDNPAEYSPFERQSIQREKLSETVEFCRKSGIKRMEIIHGVGDGILQKLVYDALEAMAGIDFRDKEILHHQSGAVLVDIR